MAGTVVSFGLTDAGGAALGGDTDVTATVDGMDHVVFTPLHPLSPNTAYTASVRYCDAEHLDWTYTTSAHGEALGCDPLNGWYRIDLASAATDPPVGEVLLGTVPDDLFMGVGTDDFGDTTLYYTTGAGAPDLCREPTDVFGVTLDLPSVVVDGGLSTERDGLQVSFDLIDLQAHISPDCTTMAGSLRFMFDLRHNSYGLPEVMGTSDIDEACSLLEGTHTPCRPCEDGPSYCVEVVFDQVRGTRTTDDFNANAVDFYDASYECGTDITDACGCAAVEQSGPWQATLVGLLGLLVWRRRDS